MATNSQQKIIKEFTLQLLLLLQIVQNLAGVSKYFHNSDDEYMNREYVDFPFEKSMYLIEEFNVTESSSIFELDTLYVVYYIGLDNIESQSEQIIEVNMTDDKNVSHNCVSILLEKNDFMCTKVYIVNSLVIETSPNATNFSISVYGTRTTTVELDLKIKITEEILFTVTTGENKLQTLNIPLTGNIIFSGEGLDLAQKVVVSLHNPLCKSTTVYIKLTRTINDMTETKETQFYNSCQMEINKDDTSLVMVMTNSTSTYSELPIGLQLDHKRFNIKGLRPGHTDIFLIIGRKMTFQSVSMSAPAASNWVVYMISFYLNNLEERRIYHGERLTAQQFNLQSGPFTNHSIVVNTGKYGTDDGIMMVLHCMYYRKYVTLDTEKDDFQPNATDYFFIRSTICYGLVCVTVKRMAFTSNWTLNSITMYKNSELLRHFIHENLVEKPVLFCDDQNSGDYRWDVTFYGGPVVKMLHLLFIGNIKKSMTLYTSPRNLNTTVKNGELYTFNLFNIGELIVFRILKSVNGILFNLKMEIKGNNQKHHFIHVGKLTAWGNFLLNICGAELDKKTLIKECLTNVSCNLNTTSSFPGKFKVMMSISGINIKYVNLLNKQYSQTFLWSHILPEPSNYTEEVFCSNHEESNKINEVRVFPPQLCMNTTLNLTLIYSKQIIFYDLVPAHTKEICLWKAHLTTAKISTGVVTTPASSTQLTEVTTAKISTEVVTTPVSSTQLTEVTTAKISTGVVTTPVSSTQLTEDTLELTTTPNISTGVSNISTPVSSTQLNEDTLELTTTPNISTPVSANQLNEATNELKSNVAFTSSEPTKKMCCCKVEQKILTEQELKEKWEQLTKELSMPRKNSSKYIRSKNTMKDERSSSLYIGSMIVVVVVIPFALIILMDVIPLVKWLLESKLHII